MWEVEPTSHIAYYIPSEPEGIYRLTLRSLMLEYAPRSAIPRATGPHFFSVVRFFFWKKKKK